MKYDILSFGGGVQSTAIAVLIAQNKIPKPDLIIFADTGREKFTTFDYMQAYTVPLLQTVGLTIQTLKAQDYLSPEYFKIVSTTQNGKRIIQIPAFTDNGGKMPTYCSGHWKVDVIRRYLRQQAIETCTMWLGISKDEARRVRQSSLKWIENFYPLIDGAITQRTNLILNRSDCLKIVEQAGLPPPPKSSCYICPNMSTNEWQALSAQEKALAQTIETDMQEAVKDTLTFKPFLHQSYIPISDVIDGKYQQQALTLESACTSGFCFT